MTDAGWIHVMRSAGSKGVADLLMVHPDHGLALVQVGTQNKALGPAARVAFVGMASLCGALPLLAVAPVRLPVRYWCVTCDVASSWEEWSL
jgi:hypothetical protein